MSAQFTFTHHITRLWWTLENHAFTSCNTHVRKNSVWNASASSRLISLLLKDVFSKVKFDDASKLLARVPIFLQNDTPFSFPTNQKVSFWGKWQTVVTFSLNRCSMCTPLPQKLLKVLKRVLVTSSSVVPTFRPLFLMNEPSFLGVFRCFWAFFGHFHKNIPPYYTHLLKKSSGSSLSTFYKKLRWPVPK